MSCPSAASTSTPERSLPSLSGPRRRRGTDVRRFAALPTITVNMSYACLPLLPPLTVLCSPRAQSTWGPAEQPSFDALKTELRLTSVPVLRVWDPARPTRLLTDA